MSAVEKKSKQAQVRLNGEKRELSAGLRSVAALKSELGVDPAFVLFLVEGRTRRPLADHEQIDVKNGLRFEAVPGGGVS